MLIGQFCMETAMNQPWTWNVLYLAPLGTQVNGIFKEPSNKVVCPMVQYKMVFSAPGDPCAYISGSRQASIHLGFWTGQEPHHLFPWTQMVRNIFKKIQLRAAIVQDFWHLKYRDGIYSGKAWLGLNSLCDTRFSLIELVFNWYLDLGRN